MADDKTKRNPQDAARVNVNEEYEVRYWTDKFGVSEQQLRDAVAKVGVSAAEIERELQG